MFNAILKTLHFFNDREGQLYSAIHLRKQLISHMVGHIDLLYPIVKQGILENYGWQEEEDEDDDNTLPKVGPFSIHSWAMYMKDYLVWGALLILGNSMLPEDYGMGNLSSSLVMSSILFSCCFCCILGFLLFFLLDFPIFFTNYEPNLQKQ